MRNGLPVMSASMAIPPAAAYSKKPLSKTFHALNAPMLFIPDHLLLLE